MQNCRRTVADFEEHRLRAREDHRSSLHNQILRLLFAHSGYHFSENDIVCLTKLETPGIDAHRIVKHLGDIVGWRLVQRIEIDPANVFYDTNTSPHLHVYHARNRTLSDAPSDGIVTTTA